MSRHLAPILISLLAGIAVPAFVTTNSPDSVPDSTQSIEAPSEGARPRAPLAVGHPTFASPHANPIAVCNDLVFVVNTPSDTVDVIDRRTKKITHRINVGIDPVSLAVRPDKSELWVSNHVSDSVSVIDIQPGSPTYLQITATVQDFNSDTKATTFDEPMSIAFAGNRKAYVALSSENQIAVIDVASRKIQRRLSIPAQDPRAIFVRNNRLFVVPFESNNKTQLSGGGGDDIDNDLVTFDAWQHSITVNNVLSLGHVTDIVKHPDVPDRDLFVFDTETDKLIQTVDTLGTLLYGLTVDSKGEVYIAQTDARNDSNGRAGTKKHGMKEMENRAFLNQITRVRFAEGKAAKAEFIDLEPLPPNHPQKEMALATPYAIQISADDATIVATAAGSDKLFTVDTASGEVLGRVPVGVVPRGIALENGADGNLQGAWVYNAVANTVSVVDLTDTSNPTIKGFVTLEDPTHKQVKLGRTWFNDADGSSTGTFSCESCHPDSNTDQLLWVLATPIVTGGDQIMPRSTMPVRGLRDTAPFHWDGVLGDPYGGNNSANIYTSVKPVSDVTDQTTSARHLVDASLGEVLMQHGGTQLNDEGKKGGFSAAERDDLALYLLSVSFPPAQRRAYDNVLSHRARKGFELFHIAGDLDPARSRPNVCGDCHRMPFFVSTNTPGTGMEAPTWRGAYDRFLILPQGRLNIVEFPFYKNVAERGQSEEEIWRFSWGGRQRFNPVWNMVVEGSTGFSGSFARQVTLNQTTFEDPLTINMLNALELSAAEGGVVLEADGVIIEDSNSKSVSLQFDSSLEGGHYVSKSASTKPGRSPRRASRRDRISTYSREQLLELAEQGRFVGTFTGRHGELADVENPQPALWTLGPIEQQRGRQEFPILYPEKPTMSVSGRNFEEGANVYVDGRRVEAEVVYGDDDDNEEFLITLNRLPAVGLHTLQVQTKGGMFSNDFLFHVAENGESAVSLNHRLEESRLDEREIITRAIRKGDLDAAKAYLARGKQIRTGALTDNRRVNRVDARNPESGSTPLHDAALYNRREIVQLLIEEGADVNAANRDGNTALHSAAFLGRKEIVTLLLKAGASPRRENQRGESVVDVVSGEWSEGLANFYTGLGRHIGEEMDLDRIQQQRVEMAALLKTHRSEGDK